MSEKYQENGRSVNVAQQDRAVRQRWAPGHPPMVASHDACNDVNTFADRCNGVCDRRDAQAVVVT